MAAGGPGLGSMASAGAARKWLLDQSASRLADAQRQLHITPAQAPAWDRFAASVGDLVTDLSRFEADPLSASALQRVNRRVDIARNRYTALESVADAMNALYAVLSDEQRTTADRLLAGAVPSLYEGSPFTVSPDPVRGPNAADAAARRPSRGETQRLQ